ncbi:MAG: glycogen/starch synthase [Patescibacteria group bacterium]|jgi:starch synthase
MSKKLKIVHISSEVAPFSKTGGLGDVVRSLPKALKRLGQEVIIITVLYGQIIDKKEYKLKLIFENINLRLNSQEKIRVNYWRGYLMAGLPVYFVECKQFFSKHKKLYGSTRENARFLVFNVAALKLLSLLKFSADIIHCHDWQTGLIPYYLKTDFRYSKTLKQSRTIFTIHNLVFQLGHNWWEILPANKDYGRTRLPHLADPQLENINFAKRAILSADAVNTVSEQYREEIMTKKFGQDLHRILKNRASRLFGIINGIDYNAYNPQRDRGLFKCYSAVNPAAKADNKIWLQKEFNLPVDAAIPILCTTSRVTFQKGFEFIIRLFPQLVKLAAQFIIIGTGEKQYIKELQKIAKRYPAKIIVIPSHSANQKYETSVYAGADFFLLPSVHEPCGINQLIAMRYGCIPIVREIGGLYDTVENFEPTTGRGTGFTFKEEDESMFYAAIIRALENYKHKNVWNDLVKRAMKQSSSWEIPAKKYVELYKKIIKDSRLKN